MNQKNLFKYIIYSIIFGVIIGCGLHFIVKSTEQAQEVASYFNLITDIFLRLVKMIIAPLIFATIVTGLVSMAGTASAGRIALKSFAWFLTASIISLLIGSTLANIFEPGKGLNLIAETTAHVETGLNTSGFSLKEFIAHIFPSSMAQAMANNEILQVLVFSLFFGSALAFVAAQTGYSRIAELTEELTKVMFRIADYVMYMAPMAVFAALVSALVVQGLDLIFSYGKLVILFYIGTFILWGVIYGVGRYYLGVSIHQLIKLIREPLMLAFSTSSTETAYPKIMEALNKFGAPKQVTSFVLPLGYSFNQDGSMMYQSFAILFIAQAYNIDLSFTQQVIIFFTLMITSKGTAGVARASVVVVAATLPILGLPVEGVLLILAIDQIIDMGRTATNVIGNSIASAVIAKSEKKYFEEENTELSIVLENETTYQGEQLNKN